MWSPRIPRKRAQYAFHLTASRVGEMSAAAFEGSSEMCTFPRGFSITPENCIELSSGPPPAFLTRLVWICRPSLWSYSSIGLQFPSSDLSALCCLPRSRSSCLCQLWLLQASHGPVNHMPTCLIMKNYLKAIAQCLCGSRTLRRKLLLG